MLSLCNKDELLWSPKNIWTAVSWSPKVWFSCNTLEFHPLIPRFESKVVLHDSVLFRPTLHGWDWLLCFMVWLPYRWSIGSTRNGLMTIGLRVQPMDHHKSWACIIGSFARFPVHSMSMYALPPVEPRFKCTTFYMNISSQVNYCNATF